MKLMLDGKEVSGMGHYVMAGDIKDATAEDSNVLSGKAYYNNNGKREGTMPNRGGMRAELTAGGSVTIPEGYHNGEGVVRAQDLASQTEGTAAAANIEAGYTAWVNGAMVEGEAVIPAMPDIGFEVLGALPVHNGSEIVTLPDGCTHVLFEDKIGRKTIAPVNNGITGYTQIFTYATDGSYYDKASLGASIGGQTTVTCYPNTTKSITCLKVV